MTRKNTSPVPTVDGKRGKPVYRGGFLALNPKCVKFVVILIALFLLGVAWGGTAEGSHFDHKNWGIAIPLIFISILGYLGMAEYDYQFNCDAMAGGVGPLSYLKNSRQGSKKPLTRKPTLKDYTVYSLHIVMGVGMLLAVYFDNIMKSLIPVLGLLALFVHGYALWNAYMLGEVLTYETVKNRAIIGSMS